MPESYWTAPVLADCERIRRVREVERDLAAFVRKQNHLAGHAVVAEPPSWARSADGSAAPTFTRAVAGVVEAASARPDPEVLDPDTIEARAAER
jgi:hypothetical protein